MSEIYDIQIRSNVVDDPWQTIVKCSEEHLEIGMKICRLASVAYKTSARIYESGSILYEVFYNERDDPDYDPEWANHVIEEERVEWTRTGF